jgi:hypothetical protein
MFEKILFPTDFSEDANNELSCITSIPGIREIILFHVIKHYAIPMGAEIKTWQSRMLKSTSRRQKPTSKRSTRLSG